MNWYFAKNGAQEGPVSTEALRAKIDSGEVAPTDLAWREGLADWMPVSKIPDFTRQPVEAPAFEAVPVPASAPVSTASYSSPVSAAVPTNYQQVPVPGQPLSSGMAIGALVCGILAFLGCCAPYVSGPLAIVAIILGHVAISKAQNDPARFGGKGMARAGLITGYLGLVFALITGWFALQYVKATPEQRQNLEWIPFLTPEQRQQYKDQLEKEQQRRDAEMNSKAH